MGRWISRLLFVTTMTPEWGGCIIKRREPKEDTLCRKTGDPSTDLVLFARDTSFKRDTDDLNDLLNFDARDLQESVNFYLFLRVWQAFTMMYLIYSQVRVTCLLFYPLVSCMIWEKERIFHSLCGLIPSLYAVFKKRKILANVCSLFTLDCSFPSFLWSLPSFFVFRWNSLHSFNESVSVFVKKLRKEMTEYLSESV